MIPALSLFVVNPILQRERSHLPANFIFPIDFLAQHMPLMELEMTAAQLLFSSFVGTPLPEASCRVG